MLLIRTGQKSSETSFTRDFGDIGGHVSLPSRKVDFMHRSHSAGPSDPNWDTRMAADASLYCVGRVS